MPCTATTAPAAILTVASSLLGIASLLCLATAERVYTTPDIIEAFPSCSDGGECSVAGRYRISDRAHRVCGSCTITAHNAVVELVSGGLLKGGERGFLTLKGNLTLIASSPSYGACLIAEGPLFLEDATVTILGCRSTLYPEEQGRTGGAMETRGRAELLRSHLIIRNASAGRVMKWLRWKFMAFMVAKSKNSFLMNQTTKHKMKLTQGGCAFFGAGLRMYEASSAVMQDCAADVGGCFSSHGDVLLNHSELQVQGCHGAFGGGMYLGHRVPEWRQTRPGSGSTLQERASYSPRVGKGGKGAPKTAAEAQSRGVALSLHAPAVRKDTTSFRTLGSRVTIKNCWATSSGAGIHILKGGFDSNDTEMLFEHCRSGSKGGAIFAEDTILRQRGGVMTFRYSKAVWGGSIYVRRLIQEKGTMNFLNSTSRKNGGAISTAKGVHQEGGLLSFEHCESQKLGGAIMVSPQAREESIRSRGVIRCADTYALMGGCLATIGRGVVALDTFELNHSASQVLGNLAYVRGAFSANAVHIADESVRIDAAIVGLNTSNVSFLNCSKTPSCHLRAVILALGPAVCSPGSGIGAKLAGGEEFRGCFRCEDGKAQLKEALNPRCQTCPYEADKCEPNLMQLEPGVMAKSDNFTRVLHCPNAKACPGGSAPLSDALPMCAEGHDGDGCANCSTGFGRSDSSVLVCVKCAAGWKAEGLQLVYFVLSDVLLLAVATSSVLGASATSQDSSVLLNQLMSFATVAQTVLSAISQTAAYNQLSSRLKLWLEVSGVVSAIAQGESSWSMSRECLLVSLGLPKTLWHAHLVSALLQGVLLALLICLQGFWFAFVVWTNCFAPSIAASFGRYLVGYRLEPESIGGKMHWPFLPPVDNSYEFVFGMLVLCLVATTGGWWMAANSKLSPDPDYVVFLVRNYKPAYRNWETERLMRKMLLRLVAAALPIAYSPALQMWCVCLILSASLLSYSIQRPYRLELFNQVETLLLCVALVLAFSASAVLANEKHWGSSRNTQVLVLLSMSVLATVTTVTLSALVARRLYKERIRKFFTDADDS